MVLKIMFHPLFCLTCIFLSYKNVRATGGVESMESNTVSQKFWSFFFDCISDCMITIVSKIKNHYFISSYF
jgi:hypothetical protein